MGKFRNVKNIVHCSIEPDSRTQDQENKSRTFIKVSSVTNKEGNISNHAIEEPNT
jgi:hypothetical protein